MNIVKPVIFWGGARAEIRSFPPEARREAGKQLLLVQAGEEPDDWKPMKSIGPGVNEIRIRDQSGAFRIIYVAKIRDGMFVLHCFQKKTQATATLNLEAASKRYKELMRELGK